MVDDLYYRIIEIQDSYEAGGVSCYEYRPEQQEHNKSDPTGNRVTKSDELKQGPPWGSVLSIQQRDRRGKMFPTPRILKIFIEAGSVFFSENSRTIGKSSIPQYVQTRIRRSRGGGPLWTSRNPSLSEKTQKTDAVRGVFLFHWNNYNPT